MKRVVAVGGDEVAYEGQRLIVNGRDVPREPRGEWYDADSMRCWPMSVERLDSSEHSVLVDPARPSFLRPEPDGAVWVGHCSYKQQGVRCRVPAGHVYVLGDNRDNSMASRFWGFVPDADIVGRVSLVWMNFSDRSRIGTRIH